MSSFNSQINKLRDRVKSFIEINDKVDILDLKLHLECNQSDLLLALGALLNENIIELNRDNWKLIVTKKK